MAHQEQNTKELQEILACAVRCYEANRKELESLYTELSALTQPGQCLHLSPTHAKELLSSMERTFRQYVLRLPSKEVTNGRGMARSEQSLPNSHLQPLPIVGLSSRETSFASTDAESRRRNEKLAPASTVSEGSHANTSQSVVSHKQRETPLQRAQYTVHQNSSLPHERTASRLTEGNSLRSLGEVVAPTLQACELAMKPIQDAPLNGNVGAPPISHSEGSVNRSERSQEVERVFQAHGAVVPPSSPSATNSTEITQLDGSDRPRQPHTDEGSVSLLALGTKQRTATTPSERSNAKGQDDFCNTCEHDEGGDANDSERKGLDSVFSTDGRHNGATGPHSSSRTGGSPSMPRTTADGLIRVYQRGSCLANGKPGVETVSSGVADCSITEDSVSSRRSLPQKQRRQRAEAARERVVLDLPTETPQLHKLEDVSGLRASCSVLTHTSSGPHVQLNGANADAHFQQCESRGSLSSQCSATPRPSRSSRMSGDSSKRTEDMVVAIPRGTGSATSKPLNNARTCIRDQPEERSEGCSSRRESVPAMALDKGHPMTSVDECHLPSGLHRDPGNEGSSSGSHGRSAVLSRPGGGEGSQSVSLIRRASTPRTSTRVRSTGRSNDSRQVAAVLGGPDYYCRVAACGVTVTNVPEVEAYLEEESAQLNARQARETEARSPVVSLGRFSSRKSCHPVVTTLVPHEQSSDSGEQSRSLSFPLTDAEAQLLCEKIDLENQLERMEMEVIHVSRRRRESGSEPRYYQLNQRITRATKDLRRVQKELRVVRDLESNCRAFSPAPA